MCAISQSGYGMILGIVYTSDSTETIPFSIVKIEIDGEIIDVKTDVGGNYKFDDLCSGIYKIRIETALNGSREIHDIFLKPKEVVRVDVYMQVFIRGCCGGSSCNWPPAHGYYIGEENTIRINSDDLKINPGTYWIDRSSYVQTNQNNDMIIRGSRFGDVLYLLDSVKMLQKPTIPNASINQVTYYLGGVPAKYGDTTGGVVIIRTQSYFDLYYAWLSGQQ
tara:strand:+ start:327 stop:989 length:663 start_codon:yes stop_codon:yes gene_type:complete